MSDLEQRAATSIEQYLREEEISSVRHEYVDGEVFEMTGGTKAHNLISMNIVALAREQTRKSGCNVFAIDVKVRVEATNSFYYPDVLIDCGPSNLDEVFTTTPSVIFEVLSRSTAAIDRREKAVAYKRIPTLRAYVLVRQGVRRIEVFRRDTAAGWTKEVVPSKGKFKVEICQGTFVEFSEDEIYRDTEIDDRPPDLKVMEQVEIYSW
ncbi:MAG: Uma2 family endonuclease [Cyanobacteria bacterium]|nr:Uma2 family endonuclease [Cyanobacteriota bacterium]